MQMDIVCGKCGKKFRTTDDAQKHHCRVQGEKSLHWGRIVGTRWTSKPKELDETAGWFSRRPMPAPIVMPPPDPNSRAWFGQEYFDQRERRWKKPKKPWFSLRYWSCKERRWKVIIEFPKQGP